MKTCKDCGETKELIDFPHYKSRWKISLGQLKPYPSCFVCYKTKRSLRDEEYKKRPEVLKLNAARSRTYRKKHREKALERSAKWRAKNRELNTKQTREWRERNPQYWEARNKLGLNTRNPMGITERHLRFHRQRLSRKMVKLGIPKPTRCEHCGIECKAIACFEFYAIRGVYAFKDPTQVFWLCRLHNKQWTEKVLKKRGFHRTKKRTFEKTKLVNLTETYYENKNQQTSP